MFNYFKIISCSILVTFSCNILNEKESTTSIAESIKVSNCDGFAPTTNMSKRNIDTTEYCKAERLLWSYNVADHMLNLLNIRIIANCAAKYTISVTKEDDSLYFALKDTCGNVNANCMCPFDVSCDVPNITGEIICIFIKDKKFIIKLNELHGEHIIDTSLTMCP